MLENKLTICFFGNAASIHMIKWVKYFSDNGHKVHLVSYDLPREGKIDNINLHLIGKKLPFRFWRLNTLINLPLALIQTKRLIKRINPDIVHAHYVTSYGHLALLSGFHPLVITAWGSDILVAPKESLITKWNVKYVLKKAQLITCDAEHMKEAMIELGVDSSKIRIINFGIDTRKFSPGKKNQEIKDKLKIFNSPIVISLRSLEPIYDISTLIKSVPFVLKEVPETKFIIIGNGSEKKNLKRLAESLGVLKAIRFIGWISNEKLPSYLRISDVYVSTSLSDGGISSSTAEAMACGLSVVITNGGDNKKWVRDNKEGFTVPVRKSKILAEKVIYLLKNKEIREKFSKDARQMIEQRNNYYKEMEKIEEIYKNLTSSEP